VEINSLNDLLRDLQGKRGEVRLSQLADERVSSVVALTEPEMTMILSGGKTIVYFFMIVFFGLALGVVAALIMESMDHRVYVPKDVEDHLQLPVFASVSRKD
jgi:capsular polysaccharide biosynthesis protein